MSGEQSSDDKKVKLANMHYPGMKADPKEVLQPPGVDPELALLPQLTDEMKLHFQDQILCLGEKAQRKLYSKSIVVIDDEFLAQQFFKRLVHVGFGRVGIVGMNPARREAIEKLKDWAHKNFPWCSIETFTGNSFDHQLEDIVRGFDVVYLDGRNIDMTREVLSVALIQKVKVLLAAHQGKKARSAFLDQPQEVEASFFEQFKKQFSFLESEMGTYFLSQDVFTAKLADRLFRILILDENKKNIFESHQDFISDH